MEKLVITKSLSADYKNPERIAHKVLADRIGKRDPGNKPNNGDRIPFVYIENENSSIFVMPGVPSEMKAMMKNEVIPNYIEKKCKDKIYKKVFLTSGITESRLSNILSDLISSNSDEFKFSFLPNYSGVKFVVLSKSRNKKKYDVLCEDIRKLIKSYCYGFDNDTLSGVVGQILISKKITLSIAESCTGGMISKKITDIWLTR